MKKLLYTLSIILTVTFAAFSQSTTITPGSVLPQMTTAQRTGLANPVNGMMVYDTNTNSYWFYQQNSWVQLANGGGSGFWELNGLNGNEIKNTNNGGFWSANPTTVQNSIGVVNTAPVDGDGTRLMWLPSMSAFRVGTVVNGSKAWDKDSVGAFSVGIGYNAKAKGIAAFAMGETTTASGNNSTAMGFQSIATGRRSTAMGSSTTASGDRSTAMGSFNTASAFASTAMGSSTTASGDRSTAMGSFNTASAFASTAMGFSTAASGDRSTAMGASTAASGDFSTAMGVATLASGNSSTAVGSSTVASGNYSTAMGGETTASKDYSTAMGYETTASGDFSLATGRATEARSPYSTAFGRSTVAVAFHSTAFGEGTIAKANNGFTIGSFNDNTDAALIFSRFSSDRVFQIGNGSDDLNRSNVLTVLRNGQIGTYNVTNPKANLHLNYTQALDWDAHLRLQFNSTDYGNIVYDFDGFKFRAWGAGDDFYFRNAANTTVARINDTGNMTISGSLTQNSDRRLKKDIIGVTNSTQKLNKLNGYHYYWTAEDRDPNLQTGLIAQEVQALFPELVSEDEDGYLSVNYTGLIPHLIEANKEKGKLIKIQGELLEKLNKRLTALEINFQQETLKSE